MVPVEQKCGESGRAMLLIVCTRIGDFPLPAL
jgi:hypothetical protein